MTRRSTLTAAAAVAVGAVAGFAYGRTSDARKRPSASTDAGGYAGSAGGNTLVATLSQIPAHGGLIAHGLVLVRGGGDSVHAFSATCTHLGCTVNKVSTGKIFCPCHGSVFDASTGAVLQGPATKPLPTVSVNVSNGGVYSP